MAVWRKKAIESFPELKNVFLEDTSIYSFLGITLLSMAKTAYDNSDSETLTRVFDYVEWCLKQKSGELHNAACVSFYEHLHTLTGDLRNLSTWISPAAVDLASGILEWAYSKDKYLELKKAVEKAHK